MTNVGNEKTNKIQNLTYGYCHLVPDKRISVGMKNSSLLDFWTAALLNQKLYDVKEYSKAASE